MKNFLFLLLIIPITVFGQITQIGQDIAPFDVEYSAMSGNGDRVAIASNISSSTSSHTVKVYQLESNVWVQLGQDIDIPAYYDLLVPMSAMRLNNDGNILVCSTSIGWAPNEKIIKVFQYVEDDWVEMASLDFTFSESERVRGLKISNDGNTIILVNGSTWMASDWTTSGFVFVIENISGTYQHTEIFGYNHIESAFTDVDLSSDGSTIVVSHFADWSYNSDYNYYYLDDHSIDIIRKNSTNNEWEEISSTTFNAPGLSTRIATNINGSSLITTVNRYDQTDGWVEDLRVYEIGINSISQIGNDFRFHSYFATSPDLNKIAYTISDESGNRFIKFRENNSGFLIPMNENIDLGLEFGFARQFNNTGNRVLVTASVTNLDFYAKVYEFGDNLSLDDFSESDITISPNPANQNITIKNDGSLNLNKATIYDLTGRLVKVFNFQNNSTEETIDISQLNSAVYLIKIESDSGNFTKRLIKY